MNRPFLGAGLVLASFGLASAGCSQTGPKETTRSSKPADPTSWSDTQTTGTTADLPKTSRLTGGWSSEAQEIESAMGVGR